ncbi:hypothetical protein [Sneathiella sp.]|uniref:hypothetical protein n=1 Tax=Sneathiella sp. TaxID=1964365 RepID=UPI0026391C28|nr:hypothetical protein [Sneathiella sp.]MDF2366325.1 hypothetical protein [Sneathiella sp.]
MDIFYLPRQVALDATVAPLSGAKLQFYRKSTTTSEDVYTTSARDVVHTNPAVADSEATENLQKPKTAIDRKDSPERN